MREGGVILVICFVSIKFKLMLFLYITNIAIWTNKKKLMDPCRTW
jgi:hypothetical protein